MKQLALTSEQYVMVCHAAEPLAEADRGTFLAELAAELRNAAEIGDGTINAAIRMLQRRYFRPPKVAKHEGHTVHRTPSGPPIP
jgi:hypothetical protein